MIQAVHFPGTPATLPIVAIKTETQIRTRNGFDEQSLSELAASIREVGVIEPLIVRRDATDDAQFILIAGERRLLAASMAGLADVPALVREASEVEASTLQAIENLQRENLGLADTADGVAQLLKHYKTPKAVAKALGKSPAWVSKHLGVTRLCASVRAVLSEGLTEDPELLLGLDQIARMKAETALPTFNALVSGLESGTTTRASVRNALTRLKTPAAADESDDAEEGEGSGEGGSTSTGRTWTITLDAERLAKLEAIGGRDWLIAQLDAA